MREALKRSRAEFDAYVVAVIRPEMLKPERAGAYILSKALDGDKVIRREAYENGKLVAWCEASE